MSPVRGSSGDLDPAQVTKERFADRLLVPAPPDSSWERRVLTDAGVLDRTPDMIWNTSTNFSGAHR